MSCPFDKDSLDKLQAFVNFCAEQPQIIHQPQLEFFKKYLESLGAQIPPPEPMASSPDPTPEPEPEKIEEVVEDSDPESELEFDMEGCLAADEIDEQQEMGDTAAVPTEEETDKADEKRCEATSEMANGNFGKAVELLTEGIKLNPASAVLFVKRGQSYLKLQKPNACIKDCTQALEVNPDSATAYKYRGRAYRLLADWEKAASDLRQACTIDMDEQTDEWLKEVQPNAHKIEQHKLKQERKKAEKELKERAERVQKAREAHAKAQAEAEAQGGTQAPPNFGATGMGDFYKLLQDPEVMTAFKDPEVAAAFQDISKNPANFMKYQSNPKVMALISKLSSKFQGAGMGFPGGMGGFPGGFPGAGFGADAGQPKPPEDDGLD